MRSAIRGALLVMLAAPFCPAVSSAAGMIASDFQDVTVKPGDTLWSIAKKYLKDPARWDEIVKYNKSISSDPTIALPGMTLRVPTSLIKEELRAAHLVTRVNSVEFRRNATATWGPATDNMDLYRNDWIRTLDDSAAAVKFLDDDQLRLGANSMAVIKPVNKDYAVELKRGGTFFGRAKIMTAGAVVTPQSKDTRYLATVRDDMSTKVEVLKGEAMVAAAGQTVSVKTGQVSEVNLGAAPSVPVQIADLPAFEARAAEIASGIAPSGKGVKAPSLSAKSAPTIPADSPKAQLAELKLGSMVSGYRIQCSDNQDLSDLRVSKTVELDQEITAEFLGIPAGSYWCRVAPIDLLGATGKYATPRRYSLK
jgi:hypothetical protein